MRSTTFNVQLPVLKPRGKAIGKDHQVSEDYRQTRRTSRQHASAFADGQSQRTTKPWPDVIVLPHRGHGNVSGHGSTSSFPQDGHAGVFSSIVGKLPGRGRRSPTETLETSRHKRQVIGSSTAIIP
jgi:hypothetical protein